MSTDIQWTDETWNPTTGCDKVSAGCDNCYALTMAARLKGMGSQKYQTDGDPRTSGPGFGLAMHEDTLTAPLRWRKPRRVFVNSMSDLFHPRVTDEFIARVFETMALAELHTFQVLTKRAPRMASLLNAPWFADRIGPQHWPLPNVHLGVSVEDQQRADERIPRLLQTPAWVRFLSCEPLLGPVSLLPFLDHQCDSTGNGHAKQSEYGPRPDWVIVGGESGPGARRMQLSWARSLVEQCRAAGVAPFVKQLGSVWGAAHHDMDAWPADLRVREWPRTTEPVSVVPGR